MSGAISKQYTHLGREYWVDINTEHVTMMARNIATIVVDGSETDITYVELVMSNGEQFTLYGQAALDFWDLVRT